MRLRTEHLDNGEAVIVEHADGGRSMICESDGMVATLSLSAFDVRQLRHVIANTESGRQRNARRSEGAPSGHEWKTQPRIIP